MRAADQWEQIEGSLPADWSEVQLLFRPEGPVEEAATALGPLQPGRADSALRLHIQRAEGGVDRARNIFRRLDARRIWGTLELIGAIEDVPPIAEASPRESASLVGAWEQAVAELPPDWSDALCELRIDSSDLLPRAALLCAPMNPSRVPGETALRFRASGKQGYGVSPLMARRCFERMDAEGITGAVAVVQSLWDTENAVT